MRINDWSSDVCSSDLIRNANGHCVDQNVAVIGRVEIDLTTYGRHANAIAIAANAAHHAGDKVPHLWMIGPSKSESIQVGDGPRAHGEDVTQYAADTRGCALVRRSEERGGGKECVCTCRSLCPPINSNIKYTDKQDSTYTSY